MSPTLILAIVSAVMGTVALISNIVLLVVMHRRKNKKHHYPEYIADEEAIRANMQVALRHDNKQEYTIRK